MLKLGKTRHREFLRDLHHHHTARPYSIMAPGPCPLCLVMFNANIRDLAKGIEALIPEDATNTQALF